MVTGRSVGGTVLLGEDQRLTRAEALRAYTLGSAWFSGEEAVKGRIAPGQYADLALLSEDFFDVDESRIGAIESVLTMVGGEVVYGATEYALLAPAPEAVSPAWSPVARYPGHWRAETP
jgi:predicted amidohydrolase YtcJ